MKIKIDKQSDILYFRFGDNTIIESEEVRPNVIFDFDKQGIIIGVEILGVGKRLGGKNLDILQIEFV